MAHFSRLVCALALLALLIAPLSAVQLDVTVTNQVGTRLPGTHVQILVANTTLYEQTTIWCPKIDAARNCTTINDKALAQFTLSPDTYFLRLQRSGYPDQVYLQTINADTSLNLILSDSKSTYTVFGRVAVDPTSYIGETIKRVDDSSDSIVSTSTIKDNGYFILESIYPDKSYHLRVDRGTERLLSKSFSYSDIGAYYVEVNSVTEPLQNITTLPSFSGPLKADLHSLIHLQLTSGDRPMAGQSVVVTTPNGPFNLTTDANGSVMIWAAEGGDYVFDWQTLKQTVSVPKPPAPVVVVTPVVEPKPSEPVISEPIPSAPSPNVGAAALGVSLLVFVGLGVVAILILAVVFGPRLLKKFRSPAAPGAPSSPSSASSKPASLSTLAPPISPPISHDEKKEPHHHSSDAHHHPAHHNPHHAEHSNPHHSEHSKSKHEAPHTLHKK